MTGKILNDKEINKLLNELNDSHEQLKKENSKLIVDYNGLNGEYEWLKKENEELKQFKENVFKVIDKTIEWHLLQAKKCRNQGNIKKAIKFEEAIMTLNILKRDIEKLKELKE